MNAIPRPTGVDPATPRPLWSVMIPTYNCAAYLAETIRSVMAADVPAELMQIEVVDDCSTSDDPEEVTRSVGGGRVEFHQQPQNVGLSNNFNTCIQRARGHLVHILHGDDFVSPAFYARVGSVFERWPEIAIAFTRAFIVDEASELEGLSERIGEAEGRPSRVADWMYYRNPLCTPAVVVRRDFYEQHGGFRPELSHVADWDVWLRAVTSGAAVFINEALASYRMFAGNHTSQLLRTGRNFRDQLRLLEIFESSELPGFDGGHFRRQLAKYALRQSRRFEREGDIEAMLANRRIWTELASPADRCKELIRAVGRRLTG